MSVVHCKRDKFDVYIGRPGPWGNPFTHLQTDTKAKWIVSSRDESIEAFECWVESRSDPESLWIAENVGTLRGKVLGCWCSPKRCHGEVLLKLANRDLND